MPTEHVHSPSTPTRIRLAIVDDHKLILDALTVWLENATDDIEVVTQTQDWPSLMTNPSFPVDVVLMDIDLKDNIPLETKVTSIISAGCGLTLMSSMTDVRTIRGALDQGAHAFVSKSERIEAIVEGVTAAHRREQYISAEGQKLLEEKVPVTTPGLNIKQRRIMAMYAEGLSMGEIAQELHLSEETIRSHISRIRAKYREIGIDLGTKIKLRAQAKSEGLITGATPADGLITGSTEDGSRSRR